MTDKNNFNGFKLNIGKVSILTFNQAKVNIFSTEVLEDFILALEMLGKSRDVKVLVIMGEGKTFIAGANIKEMAAYSPDDAEKFSKLFHQAMNMVENFQGTVVAAVNGYALGGGCELILACDLVVASDEAVFGQPEIGLGIIPGAGGTQRLRDRIGKLKAKELIFTGRKVSANEALSIGLINRVVSQDKLFDEAMTLARDIASKPLHCLRVAKDLINSGSMDKEIEEFSKMFSIEDQKRLMNKFIKK
ncbi:MAG: putative enoyl-CoA hydratase [Candidatus Scalindua rubra]|uniref:Putative enoyl-CoA hydratase n=1 Tax=Candidatus Scalindua rubra TaxID=1872076 RepID=A0A1E3X8H0_9BACT|nr:MAG: putative enoyl-CoA hydratase [Candidatus Scalindua rubra]